MAGLASAGTWQARQSVSTTDGTGPDTCPIVGIGASAGGIAALQQFLAGADPESGLAYIVVQNLDSAPAFALTEILSRAMPLSASSILQGGEIRANHVHVMPPDAVLTIRDGRLHIAPQAEPRARQAPIDRFLASLAQHCGALSAGVVLSGTGSDGTLGMRAVKEKGGLTLAQAGAEYVGMMRSAVDMGLVDRLLPVQDMGRALAEHFRHREKVAGNGAGEVERRAVAAKLGELGALLRAHTGHDFSGYKDSTIIRRIQRRMQVLQIGEAAAFVDHLRQNPEEVAALFNDLLIGVTGFYRDPDAFRTLERESICRLFEGRGSSDTIRVWVPGCATGEEAYSLAILLRKHIPAGQGAPDIQVFATDIDETALRAARLGRYSASIERDVPPALLSRYFLREDGTYRVAGEIRDMCQFAAHDLLRDPPFSRLDLVSCRNLLIYLNGDLQNRVIPLFHYALRAGGHLFLGMSEHVTRHERLFDTVDKAQQIFCKRAETVTRLPLLPLSGATPVPPGRAPVPAASGENVRELARRQILDHDAPAYVVTTAEGDLLHSSGQTREYLEVPPGAPDSNILAMARPGLRTELRAAMHQVRRTGRPATREGLFIGVEGGRQSIELVVQPLRQESQPDAAFLVLFRDLGRLVAEPDADARQAEKREGEGSEQEVIRHLERELRTARENLEAVTGELAASNERLASANEEITSINQELQSSKENLDSSKEELRSVNADLNARLAATGIATVFLDRKFRITNFTPVAKELFHLVDSDVGSPIVQVRPRFDADSLQDDAEHVLSTLDTVERRVAGSDAPTSYIMRVLPYRTAEDEVAGIALTFCDVTRFAEGEACMQELSRDIRDRVDSLESVLDLVPVGILISRDTGCEKVQANRRAVRILGYDEESPLLGLSGALHMFCDGRELQPEEQPLRRCARNGEAVPAFEARLARRDGRMVDVIISSIPLFDQHGRVRGAIAALVDISDRKAAELRQEELLHELQHRVKNILATVSALSRQLLKVSDSPQRFAEGLTGRLQAMARTHELISRHQWEGADLRGLVDAALGPFVERESGNVSVAGPILVLRPDPAAALGLVFHELASNAAKYGAFARGDSRVDVRWSLADADGSEVLRLTWEEHVDGPIAKPMDKGFGTTFIERSVAHELGGSTELELREEGLRCTMEFPIVRAVRRKHEHAG